MNLLEKISYIWNSIYDKDNDPKLIIESEFHKDYHQSINGLMMNRDNYINHVIEQRKNLVSIKFNLIENMIVDNRLFMIYEAIGMSMQGDTIVAEIISYFEFKEDKIFKIHGQVQILEGNPQIVDIDTSK